MKIRFLIVFLLIANVISLLSSTYIVKFKDGFDNKKVETIQAQGITIKPAFNVDILKNRKNEQVLSNVQQKMLTNLSNYYIIDASDNFSAETLKKYDIESIEPNYIYKIEQITTKPNDTYLNKQWSLGNANVFSAWKKATGKGIVIGVVDTGIDFYHPDLINQLWINSKEDLNKNGQFDPWPSEEFRNGISGDLNGIDDDGNGFIDDVIGYDFVDQFTMNIGDSKERDAIPYDEHSHGTAVSGVISAQSNNHIGISGIAFDSKIITLRAFDVTGNGESDDIANAIVYAALQGAKVLNFSFGEVYLSSIVYDAVKFANALGVTMVASSGNNNWDLKHYPSDFEEVISVSASNSDNIRSANGNYGNRLDITAPGYKIYTTLPDTSYGEKSGTSFSAPHIAAAAGLLLEMKPELTPDEVCGILKANAKDVGDFGWDYQYAAGILDIGKAVNHIGNTVITVKHPVNEAFIEKEVLIVPIVGTIANPLFKSYDIQIGIGERPKYWTILASDFDKQIINDTIYNIDLKGLKDTTYTVRIVINLSNNSTLEKRFYINLISQQTKLQITKINPIQVFNDNYKTTAIYAVTNYPSFFYIKYRPKGSQSDYKTLAEFQKFTNFHSILIEEPIREKTIFEAIAVAHLPNGVEYQQNFEFEIEPVFIAENSFNQKDYGFPMSYLLNKTADFYGNGKECVVVNDLSTGSWGNIKVYQFENNEFYFKNQLTKKWIPKGIGDSNGDGIPEIFSTVFRESALFQAKSTGESPFSNLLFSDTMSLNFWAQDMFDIDKDGIDELIAYSDTSFLAYKLIDGRYKLLSIANPKKNIGTYPGLARGDFDNDGNIEICFGNRYGNIFIFEFANNKFSLEYTDSSTFSSSEQYITQGDFTGDGIPEIVIGNFGSSFAFGYEEASDPIWTFRIFKASANGVYNAIDTINIFGVRGGIEYNNGVSAGDLDKDNNDELIISTFPYLYVFKWNSEQNRFNPIWNYPYTYSNTAIIHDFDKNGINELGICTFSGTRFFEMDINDSPSIPIGLKAWSIDTNKVYLEWQASDNANEYEILNMVKAETGGYRGYTALITSSTNAIIDTMQNNTIYEFVVRAINNSIPEKVSDLSNIVEIFTHKPIRPRNLNIIDGYKISLEFDGDITTNNINPGNFSVLSANSVLIQHPVTVLQLADTKILLSFSDELQEGSLKLLVGSFRDKYNSPTISDTLEFIYTKEIIEQLLYLTDLTVINRNTLKLNFSDDLELSSARNVNNYVINPYGTITEINMDGSSKNSVIITLSNEPPMLANGKVYTITAENIISNTGKKITSGAGNTLGFVFYAEDAIDAYIYPNPVKYSNNLEIYFANLPSKAIVKIYNLEMQEIRELFETDGNGGVEWDGKDNKNNTLTSGVYLFKVIKLNPDGTEEESELKKFLILP
jgi:subtilisin family serine protease